MSIVDVAKGATEERSAHCEMRPATIANTGGTIESAILQQDSVNDAKRGQLHSAFLDMMSTMHRIAWFSMVSISGRDVLFKLDTGTEVTANSKSTWQLLERPILQPPDKQLLGQHENPYKS